MSISPFSPFFILVILLVLIGVFLFSRSRSKDGSSEVRSNASTPTDREITFETIQPGDAVIFWDGSDALVETVLDCEEHLNERTTRWRWVFLSEGRVVEVSPMGKTMYGSMNVFHQGSAPFADLTAEADDGGVLKTFEQRVRDGSIASAPVTFIYDGTRYVMKSTGTFVVSLNGKPLQLGPWADINPNEGDNVYFKMGFGNDGEAMGIWTTHIAFLTGKRLSDVDIKGLYGQ